MPRIIYKDIRDLDERRNNPLQTFDIDPKTGKKDDDDFVLTRDDGTPVKLDGDGAVIFNDLPATYQPMDPRGDQITIDPSANRIEDFSQIATSVDFVISELSGGTINGILDSEQFGTLCDTTDISRIDELQRRIRELEALVAELRIKADRADQLEADLNECQRELASTVDELEDVLNLAEELQECNSELEAHVTAQDSAITTLANELEETKLENAELKNRLARMGGDLSDFLNEDNEDQMTERQANRISSHVDTIIETLAPQVLDRLNSAIVSVRSTRTVSVFERNMQTIIDNIDANSIESILFDINEIETILGISLQPPFLGSGDTTSGGGSGGSSSGGVGGTGSDLGVTGDRRQFDFGSRRVIKD